MVSMKADKCPNCGGIIFKLAGKASKLCHDECLKCRQAAQAKREALEDGEWELSEGEMPGGFN